MQSSKFLQLPTGCSVLLNSGCTVLMTPSSYFEGEPVVTYSIQTVSYIIPQRAVKSKDSFLSRQLLHPTADMDAADIGNIKVRLDDPVFQDPYTFSLILDYLNRSLDTPTDTLRQANMSLSNRQWASLVELEHFVFSSIDRNPYWTGLTNLDFYAHGNVSDTSVFSQAFSLEVTPDRVKVDGSDGFALRVNLTSITNPPTRPVSLLKGHVFGMDMEFPFPVDFKKSYFIPHQAIRCTIKGTPTVCEGVLESNGYLRIEPIQAKDFLWFHFEINPRIVHSDSLVYEGRVE